MSTSKSPKAGAALGSRLGYKITHQRTLFVYWHGKHVRTYTGHKAESILDELEAAASEREVQYALARVTGNFKRGNERSKSAIDP